MTLLDIYHRTLARCAPERLVREALTADMPRDVVAIGKCAGALLDGIAHHVRDAIVAMPYGYREPRTRAIVVKGGHPEITRASFEAGVELQHFVDAHDDILFLVSGGGSACVEDPLPPFTREQVAATNQRLLSSGLPIHQINVVRKHLSAIKGGRLIRSGMTLVYSDVGKGRLADVASGPTLPDLSTKEEAIGILQKIGCDDIVKTLQRHDVPDTIRDTVGPAKLIADNETLTTTAILIAVNDGATVERWEGQIETDVEEAAQQLAERAGNLGRGQMLVAGGEPTVRISGDGRGGRCSELAVRFARAVGETADIEALFASSDGVDGNSGAAGIHLPRLARMPPGTQAALERSDSMSIAAQIGEPIMIAPSGNNLRDLYLLARR
ncbi:MAG TPA: DUF4147 domain-containing protein [Thermoanaerobaculia bacterium]|jgi:glycerate-2-kinase|nr:DUF4147 domain-containing protein [Thermoanaerobaculia bacterium]